VPPRHVYVHVPFCARRCAYCDFAIAVRRDVPVDEYLGAVRAELDIRFPGDEGWVAETLYLGGGTPSRLGGEGVARLLDLLRSRIDLAPDAEVTIESNPEDVDRETAAAWRRAGVNRVSLGSQSFDDRVLAWMHRVHDAARIEAAVGALRGAGIGNLSLDLIFALPAALERDWERDVRRALDLEPDHLSLYGLTVEPHTPLGRWRARGSVEEATEERYEEEFLHAHEAAAAAGLEHYEVSNFARAGRQSRHNRSYWRGVPYAGIGPGAHEFDGAGRRWNAGAYAAWMRTLADGRDPVAGSETLSAANRIAEDVYLGLRTTAGLALRPSEEPLVSRWVAAGWGRAEGGRLILTPLGWLRLDAIAAALTDIRSR
jgi:oxygen-independent coproporphyrinogen-3 oxidase